MYRTRCRFGYGYRACFQSATIWKKYRPDDSHMHAGNFQQLMIITNPFRILIRVPFKQCTGLFQVNVAA